MAKDTKERNNLLEALLWFLIWVIATISLGINAYRTENDQRFCYCFDEEGKDKELWVR